MGVPGQRPAPRRVCGLAAAAAAFLLASAEEEREGSCEASESGCGGRQALASGKLARELDCDFREPKCMALLNASAGVDLVQIGEVMAKLEEVGRENLHKGGVTGSVWIERFAKARCESLVSVDFPKSPQALEKLRARMRDLETSKSLKPLLVHADALEDGIGARFKKAVELVSAALHIGFYAVALAVPPAGSLIHPAGWDHGAVHCHESPAQSLKPPTDEMYPLRCWRFELQADFLAQSAEPEGRVLLWGAEPETDMSPQRFACMRFPEDLPDESAWNFHRANQPQPEVLARLFESARAFAAPMLALPARREASCGHGGPPSLRHLALHVRRGDVGDSSGYAATQRMAGRFGDWLCSLAAALGIGEGGLAVHVHTEAKGQSRGDVRRLGLEGFGFEEEPEDNVEPTFHMRGHLEPPPKCSSILKEVHVAVNDNPRDALLCMARADILVTSHSSLGWASAVLSNGLVLQPDGSKGGSAAVHWDLRDQYLDWAPNWFLTSDVHRRPEALAKAFGKR